MKKTLLSILFLSVLIAGQSQPKVNRATASNTVVDSRLAAGLNFYLPIYSDTLSANASVGIDSSGAMIWTRVDNQIWKRLPNPKRWALVSPPYQPIGNYITGLHGDGVAAGPGNATFTLSPSGVTAGSYTNLNATIDAKGRILFASNGSGGGVTDGDKGQITVSAGGANWFLNTNTITNENLRQSSGLSIIGRSANSTGNVADIIAATDEYILLRRGTSLIFGQITGTGVANNTLTFNKLQTISAAHRLLGTDATGGNVSELTPTQVTAMLNLFNSSLAGLVPAPGTSTGYKVLHDNGVWSPAVDTSKGIALLPNSFLVAEVINDTTIQLRLSGEDGLPHPNTYLGSLGDGIPTILPVSNLQDRFGLQDNSVTTNRRVLFSNNRKMYLDSASLIIHGRGVGNYSDSAFVVMRGATNTSFRVDNVNDKLWFNTFSALGGGFSGSAAGVLLSNNKVFQLNSGSYLLGYQAPIELRSIYAINGARGVVITNDTLFSTTDSTQFYPLELRFRTHATNIETARVRFRGDGAIWTNKTPVSSSSSDSVIVQGTDGFFKKSAPLSSFTGGGGGLTGGNLGSGNFPLYVSNSSGVKRLGEGYGVKWDSATTNLLKPVFDSTTVNPQIRATVDISSKLSKTDTTAMLAGYARNNRVIDSMSAVQGRLNAKHPLMDFTFQSLTDGSTITGAGSYFNFRVVSEGNRTFAISSPEDGKTYNLMYVQDGTGGRTLTLPDGSSAILNTSPDDSTLITLVRGNLGWTIYSSVKSYDVFYPMLVGVVNVTTAISNEHYWTRSGNIITVWGTATITATAGSTDTEFDVPLPISSSLSLSTEVKGSGDFVYNDLLGSSGRAYCRADVSNDRAIIKFVTTATVTNNFIVNYSFSYQVH